MKKRKVTLKRLRSILKEPEVKRMSDRIKHIKYLAEPKRSFPCFPSVRPPLYVEEESYDPDCFRIRRSHYDFFSSEQRLNELVAKKLKEKERLRKIKKNVKEYMRSRKERKERMETEDVNLNLVDTQAKEDVCGVEDGHGNREELMLDVSASSQVDEPSPYKQTGNLMVEGLKSCTTEAGKKTASHSEGI